ncbi:MAG: hypothetical protein ACLFVY_03875, partial [Phycisphaerae bacterium]
MVAAKTSRKPQSMAENFAPSDSMAESSAQPIPGGCHGRVGRASGQPHSMAESSGRSENTCERFFWALQGVNYNVYGIVSASGDLVERYEYTPYGQRTVYSRGWLKCDLNGDGVVDSTDWDLYVYYRSHPQEGASIADYDGDGHVDMDGDGDRIDDQQGRSVADDPLVMYSRLESSRIDRQGWTAGGRGGYGSLCDIGHQGLLHDKEFGPASTGLVHNRRRTLNPLLARFMQRDPKDSGRPSGGYHDGMSLYEYVQSRPHMENDAPGLGIAQRAGAGGGGIHQNAAGEWETTKDTVVYNDLPGDRPSGWQTAREIVDMRNQGTEWECLRGQKQARFVKVLGGRCI